MVIYRTGIFMTLIISAIYAVALALSRVPVPVYKPTVAFYDPEYGYFAPSHFYAH
jgi:hypothetical protein